MISSQGSSIFQTGLIDSTERELSSSQPPIGRRRSLAKSCENFVRSATSGSLAAVEAASNPFTLADTCQSRDRGEIPLLAPGQTFASMHKCIRGSVRSGSGLSPEGAKFSRLSEGVF